MDIVNKILRNWTPIPHQCETCGKQLYLEDRKYYKGKYYCKNHSMRKNR